MRAPLWYLLFEGPLRSMVLAEGTLARLLLSSTTIYLCVGYVVGHGGHKTVASDPTHHADLIGRVAEIALLNSLFTVGLRMCIPVPDHRWLVPLRLALISMTITGCGDRDPRTGNTIGRSGAPGCNPGANRPRAGLGHTDRARHRP